MGYKIEEIFSNGETNVEYYTKGISDTLFITFDSVNIMKNNEAFGVKFLKTLNVDILSFRKKRKHGYQDLSFEDFHQIIKGIAYKYKRKIAYGFSLGAYAALYYASRIDCEILAIASRVPAHPVYGTKLEDKLSFNHAMDLRFNDKVAPVIIYDTKNRIDHRYFTEQIQPNFPNLKLIKCDYAGHRVSQHLVQMGVLKNLVLSVFEQREFEYNKKLRFDSAQYLSILAEACYKRKKYRWAYKIAKKALKINPKNKRASLIISKTASFNLNFYIKQVIKIFRRTTNFQYE